MGLSDAKCNLTKAAKKLTEMDFSGDGTLDLREFLHFATYVADSDEDELLKLSETFATTTTAHGLGRVVNETILNNGNHVDRFNHHVFLDTK